MRASTVTTAREVELPAIWRAVVDQAWLSYLGGSWGVGAAAVEGDLVCSVGANAARSRSTRPSFTEHAEVRALAQLPTEALARVAVYASLEPCVLCLGAMTYYRVPRVVFAARDLSFSPGHRALSGAPILGRRVPASTGPLSGPVAAFCRLLPMVGEIEHGLAPGTFGLERRLCPQLIELARCCVSQALLARHRRTGAAVGSVRWDDVVASLWPRLSAVAEELATMEPALRRLGIC